MEYFMVSFEYFLTNKNGILNYFSFFIFLKLFFYLKKLKKYYFS